MANAPEEAAVRPQDDDEYSDRDVVDLTDEANQRWLDERGRSWTPLDQIDDEEKRQERRDEIAAIHEKIVGESND